jgi:murein L,D-transpeptidase YcbB/YkuD
MDAYHRGVAAILSKIGAPALMCAGHKEYALPKGRKPDPSFDMNEFRRQVEAFMSGAAQPLLIPASDDKDRPTVRRGSQGPDVVALQKKLGLQPEDGIFGPAIEVKVREFQTVRGLVPDGIVGPKTWAALDTIP